jgi:hypothetical protein
MTSKADGRHDREHSDAVLLAAGVADLAVSGAKSVLDRARELLGRGDKAELAEDGLDELKARGRLVLDRRSVTSPAYLEVLARHVEAGRGPIDT